MRSKNTITIKGEGINCPRCGLPSIILAHKEITQKELRRPFYYSRWHKCINKDCKTTIFHKDEYMVTNENHPYTKYIKMRVEEEENEQLLKDKIDFEN